uniref:Taurine catabolism dioxygenase TauD, TfdA family n=1 Tax=Candidatus Kentrum sp. LFY TaxID=2126342 RepID=A0A450WC43_9GAMM|nr:MAG: Taurine catabolism dioxygenase TauD, TfdA family [Candidatus Kentron sp. LFY]
MQTDYIAPIGTPFDSAEDAAYRTWRDAKLADYPTDISKLYVRIKDPRTLTEAEHGEIIERCRKANMAIYQSAIGSDPDKNIPSLLGTRFGLHNLDRNQGSDEDAITAITVTDADGRGEFIPYTNRPLHWHTDGYYNTPDRQVRSFLLHCVTPARRGGVNAMMDQDIAYILLREENPKFITALMAPDAMTIPAYSANGVLQRSKRSGPVFSVWTDGSLHMRYTMRTRNIHWKEDSTLTEALTFLKRLLYSDSPYVFRATLQPGWGVINNNVLHDRSAFTDDTETPRLLYRARYYDRLGGTV